MKYNKYSFVIIAGLLLIYSCMEANYKNTKPILSFDSQIIDVGTFKPGKSFEGKFLIRNTGSGNLKIEEITTDCSCTIAEKPENPIAPNDSAYIMYSLHPNIIGFFQQKVIIKNNSEANPVLFVLRGKVVTD